MKIEIDDVLFDKGIADLRVAGHLGVTDEELQMFLKYNSEIVLRIGVAKFFERWLAILEKLSREGLQRAEREHGLVCSPELIQDAMKKKP